MCASTIRPDSPYSDSITELEFEIANPEHFLVGLTSDGDYEVRLAERIRRSDGTLVEFFTSRGCPPAAIRERAHDDETVDSVRISAEGHGDTVFRLSLADRCIVETIEGAGAIPGPVTAADGSVRVISHVPRCVDPAEVIAAVLERHPDSEFVARRHGNRSTAVFTPRGMREALRKRSTDRQWEVLRTAYRNGYFERPREHTGEEIADLLDISSATFSQHLRSALGNLLSAVIEDRSFENRR